jgi:uncharacterized protein
MKKIDIPKLIPLFPLPATVLFPKIHLPLHIFEPRYREMIRDAMASDRFVGMVLLKEGWEDDYENNPPVHEIGCVGRILYSQSLEDGRFNIILYGLNRIQIKDHFYDRNYRQAWVETFDGRNDGRKLPVVLTAELIRQVREYAQIRGWQRQIDSVLELNLNDERLVNLFSAELDFTPIEKQFLLESENLAVQARRLLDLLGFYIEERKSTHPRMSPPSDTNKIS